MLKRSHLELEDESTYLFPRSLHEVSHCLDLLEVGLDDESCLGLATRS